MSEVTTLWRYRNLFIIIIIIIILHMSVGLYNHPTLHFIYRRNVRYFKREMYHLCWRKRSTVTILPTV